MTDLSYHLNYGEAMGLRCPKCGSSRVRQGYETPALPLRLVGIHSLLCDSCNLCFRAFALPGTVPTHTKLKSRKYRREGPINPQQPASPEELEESQYSGTQDEGIRPGQAISFARYYLTLLFKVLFGMHRTTHSLGLKYRWHQWQHWQRSKRD